MAIVFDTSTKGTGASLATSVTTAYTITGSNPILFVLGASGVGLSNITGCTYNGAAMTSLGTASTALGAFYNLFYLLNPATGTNNIILSATTATSLQVTAASYTGVKQSGMPDSSNTGGPTTTTSFSISTTTVADNCWTIMAGGAGLSAISAGAGTTIRQQDQAFDLGFICDSNGVKTPAGSTGLTVTASSSSFGGIIVSFAPLTSTAYILTSVYGTFTLTGISTLFLRALRTLAAVGTFVLTGKNSLFSRGKSMVASMASLVLTGEAVRLLKNGVDKSLSNQVKNTSSSFTPVTKTTPPTFTNL